MRSAARTPLLIGAIFGASSVAAGAFGAHALRERLDAHHLGIWNTAAQYQMYHALALLLLAVLAPHVHTSRKLLTITVSCFSIGVLIFSGTLYTLALTGIKWLGAITPLGGLLLIMGWLCLAGCTLKPREATT